MGILGTGIEIATVSVFLSLSKVYVLADQMMREIYSGVWLAS